MATATIFTGLVDHSNSTRAVLGLSEQDVQERIVDLENESEGCKTYDEFSEKVANGDLGDWYRAEYAEHQLDILSIVDIPEDLPEGKPYLFTIKSMYGEYHDYNYRLAYTSDPDATAHELAKEERGSSDDDWDESMNGYWFDGNCVALPSYKELTPAQAEIWKMASGFK